MTTAAPTVPAAPAPAPVKPTLMRLVVVRLHEGANKGCLRPGVVIRPTPGGDGMSINVAVLVEDNDFGGPPAVRFYAGLPYDQSGAKVGSWAWAPFQQGQAAKGDGDVAALRAELATLRIETASLRASMNAILSALDEPAPAAAAATAAGQETPEHAAQAAAPAPAAAEAGAALNGEAPAPTPAAQA